MLHSFHSQPRPQWRFLVSMDQVLSSLLQLTWLTSVRSFLRFQSQDAIDPATGYPLQAFSAKFSLTGMTGQLSPEVSAQILGSSTAMQATPARVTSTANNRISSDLAPGSTTAGRNALAATGVSSRNSSSIAANNTGAASTSFKVASWTATLGFAAVAAILGL